MYWGIPWALSVHLEVRLQKESLLMCALTGLSRTEVPYSSGQAKSRTISKTINPTVKETNTRVSLCGIFPKEAKSRQQTVQKNPRNKGEITFLSCQRENLYIQIQGLQWNLQSQEVVLPVK